jgi:hypothetical protein
MNLRKFFSFIPFLCFLTVTSGLVSHVYGDFSEDLVVELDSTEVYPSQDVLITVYYRITFPEDESHDIGSKVIDMEITTSGLVEIIETNDYLLFPQIGDPAVSGKLYEACNVEIHIPDDHGDYGVEEKTYDVTIDNLRDYCNVVELKVLAVKEELSIELDKVRADPGENIVVTVKYTLDAPSDVVLTRPLNFLNIELDGLKEDVAPPLVLSGVVTGGEEITIATYDLQIPEDAAIRSYNIKASASPPRLESKPIGLNLGSSQDSGIIPLFTRWDLWAGISILGGSAVGGGYAISKIVKKRQKIPTKGTKQLLVSNPIKGKGWRIAELNPDRSIKEGTERTLTDEEVEQIKRVTRVIDGSEYDDLEWTDPKTGETITWRGPDEIISPPPKPVQAPKAPTAKTTKSSKVDKKKAKKTKPKVTTTKPKKDTKHTITSPPPPPPPAVSPKPPQVKTQPKPSKWGKKLQEGINLVNKGVKGDKRIQKVLEAYKGRRIVIDIKGENTYGVDVRSDGLMMKRKVVPKKSDLYIQMSEKEMTGIFDKLKQVQEYERYKNHPHLFKKMPPKVTKLDVILDLGAIVGVKGTLSLLEKDVSKKSIRGIGGKDISLLKEIFIPKKDPSKTK